MRITRPPGPVLRPFIKTLWAVDATPCVGARRERVLPTGAMHVVFRLSDAPLRLFDDPNGEAARTVGHAIVGGARSSFYVRDVSVPAHSVGAQLHPGAAPLLLGVPGEALAERHTALSDLWGRAADEARARIAEAGSLERKLEVFESILAARLPKIRAMHPAVAEALAHFSADDADVGDVVAHTGYSHRRFIQIFREAVGLTPKLFCRVTRFQRALARAVTGPASWAAVALDAGYSDQSHLSRDFLEFAGLPPGRYRKIAPASSNHVPIL